MKKLIAAVCCVVAAASTRGASPDGPIAIYPGFYTGNGYRELAELSRQHYVAGVVASDAGSARDGRQSIRAEQMRKRGWQRVGRAAHFRCAPASGRLLTEAHSGTAWSFEPICREEPYPKAIRFVCHP